jgi:hypothetical protein
MDQRAYRHWTIGDVRLLELMRKEGYTTRRAAEILDRSEAAIANQAVRMGLSRKCKPRQLLA